MFSGRGSLMGYSAHMHSNFHAAYKHILYPNVHTSRTMPAPQWHTKRQAVKA